MKFYILTLVLTFNVFTSLAQCPEFIDPTASNPIPINVECIGDVPAPDILVVTDEADNSGIPVVAFVSDVSDGNTCPETITRTYSVTDVCGNTINVFQSIIVNDIINPTASTPASINVECNGDVPAPDILIVTDESDNCTAVPVVAFVSDVSDGLTCPEIITRTYSVTDDCGNSINITQTITIMDITGPMASNPSPINVECVGDVPAPNVLVVTDESDNCSASPIVSFVSEVSDGNTCPEVITRTYSVTDNCGNTINVTQTIIVNDITNPTASNPADINVGSGPVPAPDVLVVTDEADNCTVNPVVAFVSDISDGLACPETITRTYSVADDCGNITTITHQIIIEGSVDTLVTSSGGTLSANASGAVYQWLDCDNGYLPISSAINQSFTPVSNGNYAVEVTESGNCTDTSSCYFVDVLGIQNNSETLINIYPNPFNSSLQIELPIDDSYEIRILGIDGKLIVSIIAQNDIELIDMTEVPIGAYIIQISGTESIEYFKVIKE